MTVIGSKTEAFPPTASRRACGTLGRGASLYVYLLLAILVADEGAGAAAFLTPYNLRAVGNTIAMGAAVALTATVLGFAVAYAITVTRSFGRGALKVLFLAPLFAPSIMPAIGLIYLVGSNGLLLNLDLYGPLGVFLAGLVLRCRIR